MRQRIIYVLKHNSIAQSLYRTIMGMVFRMWGAFVKTDETLVLFVSFMGKGFNDSPKVIYDYIRSHQEYSKYHCVWAFEDPSLFPDLESITIDTLKYFKTALKAKYWVTNTNIERGLSFKKNDQIFLNTWHGVALKHIGNDCPGRKDFNFKTVNYLVVSGKYDERVCKSAFRATEDIFLRCGMPRNERLWHSTEDERIEIRNKLGISQGKKVILYAPTWRDSKDGGKSYEIKPPIHFDKWKKQLGEEYIVLFRAHHQTTKVLGIVYDDFVRNASDYPDVNDLLIASDILITDYSAIAFDFCILCKPILCYAYDYDTYLAERGTYFEMNDVYPNTICKTEEVLLDSIKRIKKEEEYEKTKRFREQFIEYGGNATSECVRALFGDR